MKFVFTALLTFLAITPVHAQVEAQAATAAPAWVCGLEFQGEAQGFKILIGEYKFKGTGDLRCVSANGVEAVYPVVVKMKALPLSPQISLGWMELYGLSTQISLFNTAPEALLGKYIIAQAQGAFIGGIGAITAVHVDEPGLALQVSLQLVHGLGINLGLNELEIKVDGRRL